MTIELVTKSLTLDSVSSWQMKLRHMPIKCKRHMMEVHLSALPSHTQLLRLARVKVRTWATTREIRLIPKIKLAQLLELPMPGTMKLKIMISMIHRMYLKESKSDISQQWFGETLAKSVVVSLKTSLFAVTLLQVTSLPLVEAMISI